MPRNHRQVPALQALMQGMNQEQISELQAICADFEGNYDELMRKLKSIDAQKQHYREVNRTAKVYMGKSRADADLLNRLEMLIWSLGYRNCTEIIKTLSALEFDVTEAFTAADVEVKGGSDDEW